ncbi:hypothetical protein LAZ67_14001997 [Cordylochernes scorpioides]|uniref:Transposase n=1 Tax=Cordylochernes scorpioides TaxID=51811 RepID=A0ABY6L8I8_9ARAC|nr:hypothetical protein LAZ67_14001997 [Cordylochernes scorpioides]
MPGHRKRRQFKQTDAFTRGMVIGLKRAGWNVGATRVTSARVDRRILRQAVAAPQATCTAILQHVQDTLDHSISTRTISRRLVANGLYSCRPLRRLPLTPPNRRQRLEWCRARSTWMTEWHRVVFSDESRFCLSSDSRRVRVWRRRGERSNPAAIVERPTVRQRGIMVWGAIAYDSRSPLLRIHGTMTAQRYVDDVLRPVTLPYLQGVPSALYQQDNARPHTARISQQALQDVQMLPWPPYSPDLSPIEHVWDIIGRRLHALPQPRSEDELWQMVEREWRAIPQDAIRMRDTALIYWRRVRGKGGDEFSDWECYLEMFSQSSLGPLLAAWLPELLEAKVAAHWRIPNSLKPASKVTSCATEFNVHQRLPQQSQTRQEADRLRHFRQRASTWADMLNAAFHYNPALNCEQFTFLQIGHMDKQWKVRIPDLPEPPEALRTLLDGSSPHSAEFMQRVRHYNNAFQMTSFGCGSRVVLPAYMPTFKVQCQVYHRIGSVLPPLNSDTHQLQPAFHQVFFIGDISAEVSTRHRNFPITKPHIVSILQDIFHRHNPYIHLFKASIEKMPSPDYKLVIKADKTPPGHHPRTFNAPTINEVAIVIVQENCDRRDIVLSKRGSGVQRINEFHRSYDALQYLLVFWNGQDGYHFHIPQLIDGVPSAHKTVSCMDFYASLLMIRSRNPGITNWLLAFGDLTHQILVDIYAKVESERLHYISAHQAQLRATEYIKMLDAIRTDRSHALIEDKLFFLLPLWAVQGTCMSMPRIAWLTSPVEIHRQLVEVHGHFKNVRKWSREFNEGRINVHDEQRSGRPSLPESTVARIDEMVRANRRITLDEIEDGLYEDCSHFSVHKIVSETLGYRKVSARWVDKWLKEAAGEWYNTGITKLVDRMKKVIEHQGDYVENSKVSNLSNDV